MNKSIESKYRLNRTKSIIALVISITIVTIIAIVVLREVVNNSNYEIFRYFTTISNIFSADAAILTIPYALEGIFKQKYNVSKQITRILFCGTICVTITMVLALCVIWPVNGDDAVKGYNFWCHIVCPILVIILFGLVSGEKPISVGDCVSSVIPFFSYGILYVVMVIVVGKENGGWEDLYGITRMMPVVIAVPLAYFIVSVITFVYRHFHNNVAKKRWNKLVEEIIERYKPDDGAGIRFMIYEMGEVMGVYDGQYEMIVPIQILEILASHYPEIKVDDMVKIFVQGALNGMKKK